MIQFFDNDGFQMEALREQPPLIRVSPLVASRLAGEQTASVYVIAGFKTAAGALVEMRKAFGRAHGIDEINAAASQATEWADELTLRLRNVCPNVEIRNGIYMLEQQATS